MSGTVPVEGITRIDVPYVAVVPVPIEALQTQTDRDRSDEYGQWWWLVQGDRVLVGDWIPYNDLPGEYGVELPRPPRVGPGGIAEESAREIAGRHMPRTDAERAGIIACRQAVAQWDAEDAERAS